MIKITTDNILTDKKFKFNLPLLKKSVEQYKGKERLFLEYALASTDVDLENEQVTENFLKSMVEQAPRINMFLAHKYDEEHTLGPVKQAEIRGNKLWVKGLVRESKEALVNDLLDAETNMGGSFGGICTKDFMQNGVRKLEEGLLLDATFTPMPINTATQGTATAAYKECTVCNQIIKSLEHKYDLEIKARRSDYIVNTEAYDYAVKQIKAGNVDNGTWKKPSYSDFGNDITKYSRIALAKHPDGDPELSGTYGFEIGKPNGNIVRQGVISAKAAAAGGRSSAGKNNAIYDAADKLLQMIDDENKSNKSKEEFVMDDESIKQFGTLLKENNKEQAEMLTKAFKEALKPEEPKKEAEPTEVKALDEDKITENVTKGVLKALGIETKEPEKEEDNKIVIMDAKGFEDMQSGLVTKTVLELTKDRQGTRKSKSVGGDKFEPPGELIETKDEEGKLKTKSIKQLSKSWMERHQIPG